MSPTADSPIRYGHPMSQALQRFGREVAEALAPPDLDVKVGGDGVTLRVKSGRRWHDLVRFVDPTPDARVMTARLKVGRRWREVELRGTAREVGKMLAEPLRPLWERPWRQAVEGPDAPVTHLVHGSSGAASMQAAGLAPRVVFADALVEGPCPPVALSDPQSRSEWRALRDAWWGQPVAGLWPADTDLTTVDRLVVWATDHCDELLMLAFCVAVIGPPELWLARPTRSRNRVPRSVGEVPPHWLLAVEPRLLDASEHALLVDMWTAYTTGDPGRFFDLVLGHPDSLIGGLRDLRNRLPHPDTGLTFWEAQLLTLLRGAEALPAGELVGRALQLGERPGRRDLGGDVVVMRWLAELDRADLVALHGPGEMWNTSFRLTELGAAVLDGLEDRVALAGFDRWFGGTRLRGAEWSWDGHTVRGPR
ncbi:MAG: hypothetical protein AAF211_16625 [Myxococcota bacterium]